MTDTATRTSEDILDDLQAWLRDNWDPDLTVGEWWERLGTSGWAAPGWPVEWYGRGLSRDDTVKVQQAIAAHGALGAPGGLGLLLAGPTIVAHGTDEQKARYLRDIVTGQRAWCQLFSEPGAGSDLAGLQCRAVADGDEWIVNGQKVWTSAGHIADLGMLIARTDPDVPKHRGITYFALDMHQPGVDVRPLTEMTGRALFNEVFLTDAVATDDAILGGRNNGWAVANTTLANERAGLGAGGGHAAASAAVPGTVMGHLERRAGDFVSTPGRARGGASGGAGMFGATHKLLVELARGNGAIDDPSVRQDLMRLHTMNEIARFTNLRLKAAKAQGRAPGPEGNTAKLAMSQIVRLTRDLGLRILGPYATLHAYDDAGRGALHDATGNPFAPMVTEMALFSPAPSIYGGTDEIQRNIIGERVLGLPSEPRTDKDVPFKDTLRA
ncbi:MAG: acyl-CoA dehydrogenase family protein [Acidimicrobiales bacterium]|jgi:alkylation response protein AidB-like acyl-CoA dehydrogenase|nr:acyl-CoA dehydrogenase family protein [Acidimicrobiales bacterium]